VEIDTHLEPRLPVIMGERIQLQQVLLNLIINAVEALEQVEGRARRISIRTVRREGESWIAAEVRDNGRGVLLTDLEELFAAFFTTKAEGTGLGLWISRSIIENHSGRLLAIPNQGQGMCFRIELPGAEPVAQDTKRSPDSAPLQPGTQAG
jgi:C4-dicarboxylate-specific signal transduction histidine kinase